MEKSEQEGYLIAIGRPVLTSHVTPRFHFHMLSANDVDAQ